MKERGHGSGVESEKQFSEQIRDDLAELLMNVQKWAAEFGLDPESRVERLLVILRDLIASVIVGGCLEAGRDSPEPLLTSFVDAVTRDTRSTWDEYGRRGKMPPFKVH